jgi:hypothetical protein
MTKDLSKPSTHNACLRFATAKSLSPFHSRCPRRAASLMTPLTGPASAVALLGEDKGSLHQDTAGKHSCLGSLVSVLSSSRSLRTSYSIWSTNMGCCRVDYFLGPLQVAAGIQVPLPGRSHITPPLHITPTNIRRSPRAAHSETHRTVKYLTVLPR